MRRRPSGSGEDDNGSRSTSTAPERLEKASEPGHSSNARERENAREVKNASARAQERAKASIAMSSRTPVLEIQSRWDSSVEPSCELENDVMSSPVQAKGSSEGGAECRGQRARLRNPWSCSTLTFTTSICAIVLLTTILHSFFTRQQDPKGCAMSYMRPAFARYSDFDTEHTRFATKYSLYLYREGGVDEDTRVKGIPVLFIPGNAGSYKQVRPIAAEAAHYFHDVLRTDAAAIADGKAPLDVFSVDFNEDITAFHGQTMLDQAEYLNEAIAFILALYHNPSRSLREPGIPEPKSVIILGHSMGGVVARTMLSMPNYQEHTVNTIVTLSAPHARAPVTFDADMVATYNDINTYWRKSYLQPPSKNPLADVTLVSVAGGGLDTMIPSESTSLTSLVPDTHGFTVFTSSIPNVWTGMDHLAIMWCDQFRKALVKAIFDVTDVRRSAQTKPQAQRIKAIRKRLLTGMEPVVQKSIGDQELDTLLTFEASAGHMMRHGERLVLRPNEDLGRNKAHVMPVPVQPFTEGSKYTLLTNQKLDGGDGQGSLTVLFCSVLPIHSKLVFPKNLDLTNAARGGSKLACKNAAPDVSYLPASTRESVNAFDAVPPFSYLQFDLSDVSEYQFVAVIEKPGEIPHGWAIAEFSSGEASSITVSKGHHQLLVNGLQLTMPSTRPMMTELKIPEVHSTLFAYTLNVKRQSCAQSEIFAPMLRQYIAEPYESKYFVNTQGGNINVHGISPYMPPPLRGGGATDGLSLQLWSDPTCNSTVEVSLKVDMLGSAGKLVMRYRSVFAAFPLLVVLIVMRKQFKVYDVTGVFMSFSESMDVCLRTSLPFIFIALTFFAVSLSKASQGSWTRGWLNYLTGTMQKPVDFNVNDLMLGTQDPFLWFLVPLFGVISVGICIAGNYLITVLMHVLAFAYGWLRGLFGGPQDYGYGNQIPTDLLEFY